VLLTTTLFSGRRTRWDGEAAGSERRAASISSMGVRATDVSATSERGPFRDSSTIPTQAMLRDGGASWATMDGTSRPTVSGGLQVHLGMRYGGHSRSVS
jgi:hypothetical protein